MGSEPHVGRGAHRARHVVSRLLAPSAPARSGRSSPGRSGARDGRRDRGRRGRDVIFWAYLGALAWLPFWFGSNDLLAWSINAALFSGLVVALELNLLVHGTAHPVPAGRLRVAFACFVLVLLWVCVQASTWTPSGWHNPIWAMTAGLLDTSVPGSISVNRDATWVALVRLLTGACSFWLALQLCRNAKRADTLFKALAWIGFGYAAYALTAFYALPDTILWFRKEFYLESVTGTFINRNTFATYMGLALICFLALLFDFSAARSRSDGTRLAIANAVAQIVGPGGLNVLGALVVGAALLRSGSRGGAVAAALAVGLFLLLYFGTLRGRSRTSAVLVIGCSAAVLAVAAAFYGDYLATRLASDELQSQERLAAYALVYRAIRDAFLQGFGFGTFADVFPLYRDGSLSPWFVWDRAHNTFLELAMELGIPATVLLLLAVALPVGRCLLGVFQPYAPAALFVAVAATAVIIVESAVDFSVQIQAVALTWAALLGAGYAQCEEASAVRRSPVLPSPSSSERVPAARPDPRRAGPRIIGQ
jgi:O-antigen ligase